MTLFDLPEQPARAFTPPDLAPRTRRPVVDRVEARVVTNEAVDRNAAHTDGEWRAILVDAIHRVAGHLAEFTVDDVWVEVGFIPAGKGPASALGPAMREAARNGWAVRTDRTKDSARPEAHRKPERVWRSLLHP